MRRIFHRICVERKKKAHSHLVSTPFNYRCTIGRTTTRKRHYSCWKPIYRVMVPCYSDYSLSLSVTKITRSIEGERSHCPVRDPLFGTFNLISSSLTIDSASSSGISCDFLFQSVIIFLSNGKYRRDQSLCVNVKTDCILVFVCSL